MKVIRVSDKAYKFFTEWAKKEGRSVCKQMDIAAEYSEQYIINRQREDYIKSLAMDSFYEANLWNQQKKMEREMNKAMAEQIKEQLQAVEEPQAPQKNPYKPDTYEWYMEEGLTRELTNDELLRVNELRLIKEGWDPVAAHKKIYC